MDDYQLWLDCLRKASIQKSEQFISDMAFELSHKLPFYLNGVLNRSMLKHLKIEDQYHDSIIKAFNDKGNTLY